jgi:hypothetical protein
MTLIASLAKQNLTSIFNQRDSKKRRAALKKFWAPHGVLRTADGTYIGQGAVDKAAASILRSYPEYGYSVLEAIDETPDAARMQWSFGASGAPPAISGLDVLVVSGGRIIAMCRFLDGAEL